MTDIPLSLIVAAADNNVIGKDNKLLWHIPADLKRFKALTLGKPCIMGRKTYESILDQLGKPLPGRTSIVISASGYTHDGAVVVATLEEAIEKARGENADEMMVIGGAQIYALALPLADRIHLTRVHIAPEGDAFFPALNENEWKETARESAGDYDFITLERG
jgi:dihydrofolate reductase